MSFTPMKHQLDAQPVLKKMDKNNSGGMLLDEMGLGKTATMSMYMITNKIKGRPDLIVCPYSTVTTWKEWLVKVSKSNFAKEYGVSKKFSCVIYHGKNRARMIGSIANTDVVITTYAIIGTKELEHVKWGRVVLDESHTIKNGLKKKGQKAAKGVFIAGKNSKSRFCISGTPFNNRIGDIASQCHFIGAFPYDDPKWWKKNGDNRNSIEEWRDKFTLRRTKEGLLTKPNYHEIHVDPTVVENDAINILRDKAERKFKEWKRARQLGNNQERFRLQGVIIGLIQKLRVYSNSFYSGTKNINLDDVMKNNAKVERMVNDVDNLVMEDPHQGVVIFSQFVCFLDILRQVFTEILPGVDILSFDGSMSIQERDRIVKTFNTSTSPRVILVSLMAGGTGLSLHHGSATILLAEPYYNPFAEQQAEERVHRLGQTNQVNVYKYYMKNSIENWITAIKHRKLSIADTFKLVKNGTDIQDFSFNDIGELFKKHVNFTKENVAPQAQREVNQVRQGRQVRQVQITHASQSTQQHSSPLGSDMLNAIMASVETYRNELYGYSNRPEQHEEHYQPSQNNNSKPFKIIQSDGDDDPRQCNICYGNLGNVAIVPCGHTCCGNCIIQLEKSKKCHVCRGPINSKMELFYT